MDAKRYQQVQDLFWQAEELPHHQREAFLRQLTGEDHALAGEVLSLLREHDPDAALAEGHRAEPVRLPKGAAQARADTSGADANEPKASSSTTKKGASGNDAKPDQRTLRGAQRTHAAPRHPKSSRRQRGARKPEKPLSSSSLLTSIGPPRPKWSWVSLWLALSLAAILPIGIAAWSIENAVQQQRLQSQQTLLPLSLNQARLEIESILDAQRRDIQRVAEHPAMQSLIAEKHAEGESENTIPDHNAVLQGIIASLPEQPDRDASWVLWDDQLQIRAIVTPDTPPLTQWNSRYAGLVAQCLQGHAEFVSPGFAAQTQRHANEPEPKRESGWIVPVFVDEENFASLTHDATSGNRSARPSGALMKMNDQLWPQVNTELNAVSSSTDTDVYLVDRHGKMQTRSRGLKQLRQTNNDIDTDDGQFRVAEYQESTGDNRHNQSVRPLTIAASSVSASPEVTVQTQAYPNYSGTQSVGAWGWLPDYDLGLISEAPVQPRTGFLSETGSWAALAIAFALAVASVVTWWHSQQIATITDARQPLGRYEVQRELGSGGMGIVYLARHSELGRDVALKVLRNDRQDKDDRQRFDREARLAASLSCPHSVTVFDFGYTADDHAFCVMELLDGLTLAEVVARSGPQASGRVVWIMQQICQSMLEAHSKGLMHRDLKPQNVMLRLDSVAGDWATVFDFGLAKPIQPDPAVFQTSETIWAGTPMYMAPERFRNPSSMDPRSDIYSIGCIAYYLLAGKPPFAQCDPESMFALIMSEHPVSISTHRSDTVNHRLEDWVRDCMRKDIYSRAADLPEMVHFLQAISAELPWTRHDAESWWSSHGSPPI